MAATCNFCFWLVDLYKSSPLKPLGQMNRNLVGSFHGRSSIKNAHFVPIGLQTWPSQEILVSDWLISKESSPLKPSSQMNRNLVGSTYGRIKFSQNRMKVRDTGSAHWTFSMTKPHLRWPTKTLGDGHTLDDYIYTFGDSTPQETKPFPSTVLRSQPHTMTPYIWHSTCTKEVYTV